MGSKMMQYREGGPPTMRAVLVESGAVEHEGKNGWLWCGRTGEKFLRYCVCTYLGVKRSKKFQELYFIFLF